MTARKKRTFNVRVNDTEQMLDLMKKLGETDLEMEAESRPGSVRIVAHGTDEELSGLELKIKGFVGSKRGSATYYG